MCFGLSAFCVEPANAQSDEIQQLLLNVEKLAQFKSILSDMKKGYTILSTGYNSVKNIAQGNFSLHEAFIDGLWLVSPEVRKYGRIADIIRAEAALISEYRSAYRRFTSGGNFTVAELDYLSKVYGQLLKESGANMDQLVMVITANQLRMSDDERLQAIDRIYADTDDKLVFLRSFNRQTSVLDYQRQREKMDVGAMKQYYNLK
ncbi:TerB family tellurite resistance protein [Mucilaginibacter sp. ZT4R22]|uniref:TerB family tellurite resistance protein n=2 Tax=Mucilaginibacter pankratovii TaxID=2772110 RepID=A0ABR7WWA0_9SPHI|nr:TerB family tellurite resistance protein [Mucilaginibacter pankratovii]